MRSLERRLESEQIAANEALAPRVTEERIAGLRQRLRELAAAAAEAAGPGPAAPTVHGEASDPLPSGDGTQSNGAGVAADSEGGGG